MSFRRSLPMLGPISPLALAWFDVAGTSRRAFEVLHGELGFADANRVARGCVRRALFDDPTASLPPIRTRDERLTRMQLRSVLVLEASLREDVALPHDDAMRVIRAVVHASGTAFLVHFIEGFEAKDWDGAADDDRSTYANGLADRMFHADVDAISSDACTVAFDVTRCLFVEWLAMLGHSELAPLFCEVESGIGERDDLPMTLDRPTTLAHGDDRCRFRLMRRDTQGA